MGLEDELLWRFCCEFAAERQAINRKSLLAAQLESAKTTKRVEAKQIDFEPGQITGLHDHPCPVVGYIVNGSVKFQIQGEPLKVLHAGDAFFEPPNKRILHFDNTSDTDRMTFVAFYLLGASDRDLIRMLMTHGRRLYLRRWTA
jgi:quercetin dioxygenase-like cupin family protein